MTKRVQWMCAGTTCKLADGHADHIGLRGLAVSPAAMSGNNNPLGSQGKPGAKTPFCQTRTHTNERPWGPFDHLRDRQPALLSIDIDPAAGAATRRATRARRTIRSVQ